MAHAHKTQLIGDPLYYYCIDRDVSPRSMYSTDVMLVQFLVAQYFASFFCNLAYQAEFQSLFMSVKSKGKRWDDGIYGSTTRRGILLFEQSAYAPVKDGIVRNSYGENTKMDKLNGAFLGTYDTTDDQMRIFRLVANPVLYKALFP